MKPNSCPLKFLYFTTVCFFALADFLVKISCEYLKNKTKPVTPGIEEKAFSSKTLDQRNKGQLKHFPENRSPLGFGLKEIVKLNLLFIDGQVKGKTLGKKQTL